MTEKLLKKMTIDYQEYILAHHNGANFDKVNAMLESKYSKKDVKEFFDEQVIQVSCNRFGNNKLKIQNISEFIAIDLINTCIITLFNSLPDKQSKIAVMCNLVDEVEKPNIINTNQNEAIGVATDENKSSRTFWRQIQDSLYED